MSYSVYILIAPDDIPFYVGKAKDPRARLKRHEQEAATGCTCPKCDVVRAVLGSGKQITQRVACTVETEAEAFEQEQAYIALLGRENLTNRSDGGSGTKGYKHTEATRAKLSAKQLANHADPDFHEWFRDLMADPERCAKISVGQQANWDNNLERKNQTGQRAKARWNNPEYRAKTIARLKEIRSTPEYKAARSEGMKQIHSSPERKALNRENALRRWADPEWRAKTIARMHDAAKKR